MGTWDNAPWDNDEAADWFGDVFDDTKLAERVAETLELDVRDDHRSIRAAASLLLFLGRTYVWPVDKLEEHLALAAAKLEEMAAMPDADDVLPVEAVRAEAALLRSRLSKDSSIDEESVASAWDALR